MARTVVIGPSGRLRDYPVRIMPEALHLAAQEMEHVYLIQAMDGGPVKIGTARNVEARLRELQCGNDRELVIRALLLGPPGYEQTLHRRFADARVRGEWFAPTRELEVFARVRFAVQRPENAPARRVLAVDDHFTDVATPQARAESEGSRRPDSNRGPLHYEANAPVTSGPVEPTRTAHEAQNGGAGQNERPQNAPSGFLPMDEILRVFFRRPLSALADHEVA